MKSLKYFWVLIVVTLGIQQGFAQGWTSTYTSPTATGNCAGLSASLSSGFSVSPVISQQKFASILPIRQVAFTMYMPPGQTSGYADIYSIEKGAIAGSPRTTAARVLYYHGADSTLKIIGRVLRTTNLFLEMGANGIALNPKTFAQDNFLYTYTSVGTGTQPSATSGFDISRYKLNPVTHMMDSTSEKVLLHIPAGVTDQRKHLGGKMRFDDFGNLYITVGDNATETMGPANTADLRGGILRITPDTTAPRGYTIPAGNFGEYWANQWASQGRATLAAQYRDTTIVRDQIYVKGTRSPYGLDLDKSRLGFITWGQCGPDYTNHGEMGAITAHPTFGGWPFWSAGDRAPMTTINYSVSDTTEPTNSQWAAVDFSSMTMARPINNWSKAKGSDTLPPVIGNIYKELTGCTCSATLIHYDGRITNPGAMPPHLNNTVLYHNCGTNNYYMSKFDTTTGAGIAATSGTLYGTATQVFPQANYTRSSTIPALGWTMDMWYGPDGYLYSMNYGECCCGGDRDVHPAEGVVRIRYTGTCQDPGLYPPTAIPSSKTVHRGDVNWLRIGEKSFSVYAGGSHAVRIMDMQGRTVYSLQGDGRKDYDLPSNLSKNTVYYLQVKTNQGTAVRGFLHQ